MKTCLISTAVALLVTTLAAADSDTKSVPANPTGKWKSEFDTRVGHLKYIYDLKSNRDKLTGRAIRERDGEKTEIELKEGTITGDQISFVEPLKFQDQDIRIEYKGKITGDQIKFTRKVGDFATTEIVANRAGQPPLDGKWKTEFDSQVGQQKYTFELKTDDEKLSGRALGESQFGKFDTPITEGKISPDGIAFVEMLKLPDNEIRIEYKGKLTGDELKLTRKVGDIATEEIVAKRVPASTEKQ